MRSIRMTIVTAVVMIICLPLTARSESAAVYLSETMGPCCGCGLRDTGAGLKQVYVFAYPLSGGITGVQFSAPKPACMTGAQWLTDNTVFPVTLGNSQIGASIGFGACKTGSPVHILTINYFMDGSTEGCCPYPVLPHPASGASEVEFADCSFEAFYGRGYWSFVTKNGMMPPLVGDPHPRDGAAEVGLAPQLSWSIRRCDCFMTTPVYQVFFGTTSEPPMVAEYLEENYYETGLLQPGTTYYWKVNAFIGGSLATTTPVWSFSTQTVVPAEETTWGQIKSLYGE